MIENTDDGDEGNGRDEVTLTNTGEEHSAENDDGRVKLSYVDDTATRTRRCEDHMETTR